MFSWISQWLNPQCLGSCMKICQWKPFPAIPPVINNYWFQYKNIKTYENLNITKFFLDEFDHSDHLWFQSAHNILYLLPIVKLALDINLKQLIYNFLWTNLSLICNFFGPACLLALSFSSSLILSSVILSTLPRGL